MYDCKILADSISRHGHRLTTFQLTYPRFIHSELLTHAMLVRNSESSRARPVAKNIEDVQNNSFVPEAFGLNQSGMQFEQTLDEEANENARETWLWACQEAIWAARELAKLDVHKSHANRLLEPYKWHTSIFSGTDWLNFFALRCHPDAQPEFRHLATMMREAYAENEPRVLSSSEWHLPLVTEEEIQAEANEYPEPYIDWEMWKRVSIGRCARVSYLTHDGRRDILADIDLYNKLLSSGHMSPFGHVARPFTHNEWHLIWQMEDALHYRYETEGGDKLFYERLVRNLQYCAQYHGWWQARADIPHEHDASKLLAPKVAV